jgi:plasmid stabilization system protein ParE
MKVVWTDQALFRLIEIEESVASRNPTAAVELTTRLIARGEMLATLWRRGRHVPELPGSPLRELTEGNYRLVYRIREGVVEVLTVFEGHRLLPREDLG